MAIGSPARSARGRSATAHGDSELRRFLARELHDGPTQTLTTLLLELADFRADQHERCDVVAQLDAVEAALREAIESLRELVYNLRGEPTVSASALMDLIAAQLNDFEYKTHIETRLTIPRCWPATLRSSAAANLRQIVGEALVNVRRHSGATHLTVEIGIDGDGLASVVIADDGRGLEPELLIQPGMGIVGMRERARLLGGRLQIRADKGAGTTVRVTFPVSAMTAARSSGAA